MTGEGHCPYRPCGVVHKLPKDRKCPPDTGDYCKVFDDIDLDLFDRCVTQSFKNRFDYRRADSTNFYQAMKEPITLA
jgi:hypothetical protein